MAMTNQDRVGKAMELLRVGLAPFVERELKSQAQDDDERLVGKKPVAEWDVAALLKVMWESWNDVLITDRTFLFGALVARPAATPRSGRGEAPGWALGGRTTNLGAARG